MSRTGDFGMSSGMRSQVAASEKPDEKFEDELLNQNLII